MHVRHSYAFRRSFLLAASVLTVSLGLVGCDDGSKKDGTQVKPSAEHVQATTNMADFMKTKPKGNSKGPAVSPIAPATKVAPAPATETPEK